MKLAVYEPAQAPTPETAGSDADGAPAATNTESALSATDVATELTDRGIELADTAAADLLVTVGVADLRAAVAAAEERPLLPVGLAAPWRPDTDELDALAERVSRVATASSLPTNRHRPLQVSVGETTATAVCDCTLVTTQPARISEYAVAAETATTAEFRSDGVVVATPLGSAGYARAAGGPRLAPDTGLAVVPIAPFAMQATSLIRRPPLSLSVERDTDVTVFADDQAVATGGTELSVSVSVGSSFSIVDSQRLVDRQ